MEGTLSRGVAAGWNRAWNGAAHPLPRGVSADDTTAITRCGPLVAVAPWPAAWGPPRPDKPACPVCRRLEREDARLAPDLLAALAVTRAVGRTGGTITSAGMLLAG